MLQMAITEWKGERWSQWDIEWFGVDGVCAQGRYHGRGDVWTHGKRLNQEEQVTESSRKWRQL